jgi:hypothetical protein
MVGPPTAARVRRSNSRSAVIFCSLAGTAAKQAMGGVCRLLQDASQNAMCLEPLIVGVPS